MSHKPDMPDMPKMPDMPDIQYMPDKNKNRLSLVQYNIQSLKTVYVIGILNKYNYPIFTWHLEQASQRHGAQSQTEGTSSNSSSSQVQNQFGHILV